jgi:hypothetical protein
MRSSTLGCALPFFRHFRNSKDARDFLTAGAAAGVASAFGERHASHLQRVAAPLLTGRAIYNHRRRAAAPSSAIGPAAQEDAHTRRSLLHELSERARRVRSPHAAGAPVGGLLFALEEVASTWSQTLTWQIFFCAMVATTTTVVLSSSFGGFEYLGPFGQLHAGGHGSSIEFYVAESIDVNIMLFIPATVIGATCGGLGALFTFLNLKVAKFRRQCINPRKLLVATQSSEQKRLKGSAVPRTLLCVDLRVLEPMFYMLLLASCTVGFTLAYPCTSTEHAHPDVLREGMLVQLTCKQGEYNELATLMYASGHHAVLLLFSRRDEATGEGREMFAAGSVILFLLVYFVLAFCAAGSAISTGLVVPMLLIGACIGRLYGILGLAILHLPTSLAECPTRAEISAATATDSLTGLLTSRPAQCYWSFVDPGAFALISAACCLLWRRVTSTLPSP